MNTKHLLALLAVLSVIAFIPSQASAYDGCARRISSYTSCGRPVYSVYQVCGYDRCGRAIGHWVTQSYRCGCSVCSPRPVISYSYTHSYRAPIYSYRSYGSPSCGSSYSYGNSRSCSPSYGHSRIYSSRSGCGYPSHRSGFYFSFGR